MSSTTAATYESESAAQSLNSYSYGNDNPITKSDPNGRAGAAVLQEAPPLLIGAGAYFSPATLGISALAAGGAISAIYLANRISTEAPFPYGTPGYFEASTLARGNAGGTDFKPPSMPPKIPWGKAILTVVGSTVALGALEEYCGNWCLPALFPGTVPQGFDPNNPNPVVGLPGMTIQQKPQNTSNSASSPKTASGSSSGASSGRSSSGSSGGGSGTWGVVGPGSFNPFVPHH